MELRQLSYFVCLYREGTMTRAAQRLNIVQPALSTQIAKLEAELGQQLFERSSRGMLPTAAGERAFEEFAPLLDRFAGAARAVKEHHPRTGQLRVGVIASSVNMAVAEAVSQVVEHYPTTHVRVIPGFSSNLVTRLREGVFDTVIINQGFRHDGLVARELVDEPLVLVGGRGAPPPRHEPVPLPMVADLSLVLPSPEHGLRRVVHHLLQSHAALAEPLAEVDDVNIILDLLRQHPWYSVLPTSIVRNALPEGGLRVYQLAPPGIARRIVAVRDPLRPSSPAETAFLETLEAGLRRLGAPDTLQDEGSVLLHNVDS